MTHTRPCGNNSGNAGSGSGSGTKTPKTGVILLAALYLGRSVAQVKTTDITHSQIVELITAGRSGDLGLRSDHGDNDAAHAELITPGAEQ